MVARLKHINLPTRLTLIRLVLSPFILPLLFVYILPQNDFFLNGILASIFIAFSLTDFFDGYFARKYRQETPVGRLLDPIADKFLMYSTVVALVAAHKLYFYWAVIFIGREFLVTGLRLIAREQGFSIHVAYIGKVKTALQLVCFSYIILNPYQKLGISQALVWNGLEGILIILSLGVTIVSAYSYYVTFMKHFVYEENASAQGKHDGPPDSK